MIKNLLEETKEVLARHEKTLDDIKWVGSEMFIIDIEKFIELADTDYDAGYGAQEVAEDLIVVGEDFWLKRQEYDGSEWWVFNYQPKKPNKKLDVKALTVEQSVKLDSKFLVRLEKFKRTKCKGEGRE